MNLTVHMTTACNMNCVYCTREKKHESISEQILTAACDLAFSTGESAGISFFGGEPLLEKGLVIHALDHCRKKSAETGKAFFCKMTTNGTLLDNDFINRAAEAGMVIGLSFDGAAQNMGRRFADGSGSCDTVTEKAGMLLDRMPHSPAMMTIAPQAADRLYESVVMLHGLGFVRMTATPAYGENVRWTDEALDVLDEQLKLVAEYYKEQFYRGRYFYFSPFDSKITECIKGINPSSRCHLGTKQVSVYTDGKIYPCTQFVGDEKYCIGNVYDGISSERRNAIASGCRMPEPCRECELKDRCTNSCGCLNRLETGDENMVSAFQCSYEQMLIAIADSIGEELFGNNRELFERRFVR